MACSRLRSNEAESPNGDFGERRRERSASLDTVFRPCMPVGEQAEPRVTWNLFYFCLAFPKLGSFGQLGPPVRSLPDTETYKVAAAWVAAQTLRTQEHPRSVPPGWPIVFLGPTREIGAVASGTPRVEPGGPIPNTEAKSLAAVPAPAGVDPKPLREFFPNAPPVGEPDVHTGAFWADWPLHE